MHNGSLSNHNRLRQTLQRDGFEFKTENDTKVAAAYFTWQLMRGNKLAVSSSKCKKCSVMLLKVERIRCKQLSGALEAERFARPSV